MFFNAKANPENDLKILKPFLFLLAMMLLMRLAFIIIPILNLFKLNSSMCRDKKNFRAHHEEKKSRNLIIGGNKVKEGDYPYLAYLEIFYGNETFTKTQYCGGTLIDPNWILTSAYCVSDAKEITVVLGAHDITSPCWQGSVECHSIDIGEDVYMLPEYNFTYLESDFAMIKLPKPSPLTTAYVSWMSWLPTNKNTVTFVGRGGTSRDELRSDVPYETQAVVVSHDECEAIYNIYMGPDFGCAQGQGMYDTCNGDSGGPVILKPTDSSILDYIGDKDLLVGVISWMYSDECQSTSYKPIYYLRVAPAFSWIISVAPEIITTEFESSFAS